MCCRSVAWPSAVLQHSKPTLGSVLAEETVDFYLRKDLSSEEITSTDKQTDFQCSVNQGLPNRNVDTLQVASECLRYVSLLRTCGETKALMDGRLIHAHILKKGHQDYPIVQNLLLHMYAKCGAGQDAKILFSQMPEKNSFSWTYMIKAHAQSGQGREAHHILSLMLLNGVLPNKYSYICICSTCARESALGPGKRVHSQLLASGIVIDVYLRNALVDMYAKCSCLDNARQVFDTTLERDVVSYNSMIAAYSQLGKSREALQLFIQMQVENFQPDKVTFIHALEAVGQGHLAEGRRIHVCITNNGFDSDNALCTAIIDMYGRCGSTEVVRRVFCNLRVHSVILWTALISVYAHHSKYEDASQSFEQMQVEGILPNRVTFVCIFAACANQEALAEGRRMHAKMLANKFSLDVVLDTALVSMYGACGCLEESCAVFDGVCEHDLVLWNAMLSSYCQHGQGKEALHLFKKMQLQGLPPNKVTLLSVLDACANRAALTEGKQVHAIAVGAGYELDIVLGTSLINMYGKCGSLQTAQLIFDELPKKNIISWNAMIVNYAQNGAGRQALQAFLQMLHEGIVPNGVTYICILSACSHAGLVQDGCLCFRLMRSQSGVELTLDHYECIIDLLSRAGHLEHAEECIARMPFISAPTSWMTLLSACRIHADTERGERAAKRIADLEPHTDTVNVLSSNICASIDRWHVTAKTKKNMKKEGYQIFSAWSC